MPFDNLCKYLAEKYPKRFATWVMGIPCKSVRVIKTELSNEPIRADSVTWLRVQGCILHLEFQVKFTGTPSMPFRMLDYWVRLYRKYRVPIIQVVIALKKSAAAQRFPDEFHVGDTWHRYQVIRLWEQDPELFLHDPVLLPLAVLARTDSPVNLLEKVAETIKTVDNDTKRRELSARTQILAGLRCSKKLIRRKFEEDIMRESVIYQDILQKGIEKGIEKGWKKGRQKGRQEGRQEEGLSLMLNILTSRWGELHPELLMRLKSLSTDQIEELSRGVFDLKDIKALADWLEHRTKCS